MPLAFTQEDFLVPFILTHQYEQFNLSNKRSMSRGTSRIQRMWVNPFLGVPRPFEECTVDKFSQKSLLWSQLLGWGLPRVNFIPLARLVVKCSFHSNLFNQKFPVCENFVKLWSHVNYVYRCNVFCRIPFSFDPRGDWNQIFDFSCPLLI